MKLVINGEDRDFDDPLTLAGLIEKLGMKQDRVAVELNRDIVQRGQWAERSLASGDKLEIVHFVGGGSQQTSSEPLNFMPQSLVNLYPHRTHESNWLMSLLCKLGLHGWYRLEQSGENAALYRWCPKVKVNGIFTAKQELF